LGTLLFVSLLPFPLIVNAEDCSATSDHTGLHDTIITIDVLQDVHDQFGTTATAVEVLAVISASAIGHTMLTRIPGLYGGPNGYVSEGYDRLGDSVQLQGLADGSYRLHLSLHVNIPSILNAGTRSIGQGMFVCFEISSGESLDDALDEAEYDEWGHPSDPARTHFAGITEIIIDEINNLFDPTSPDPTGLLFPANARVVINGDGRVDNGNYCGPGTPYICVPGLAPPGGSGGMGSIDVTLGGGDGL
jgi:hypothetical protein